MGIRKLTPSDICFLFCFPTKEEYFNQWIVHSHFFQAQLLPKLEMSKRNERPWEYYVNSFLTFYQRFKSRYEGSGFHIYDNCDLQTFESAVENKQHVIIVFAHNTDVAGYEYYERIEFVHNKVSMRLLQIIIPQAYEGYLDLSTCHLDYSPMNFRQTHKMLIVKSVQKSEITLVDWLFFYSCLFETIKLKPMTYVEAYNNVVHNF